VKSQISRRILDNHEEAETRTKDNWKQSTLVGLLYCVYLEGVGNDNGIVRDYQDMNSLKTPICFCD
jgi:hypothetical protein